MAWLLLIEEDCSVDADAHLALTSSEKTKAKKGMVSWLTSRLNESQNGCDRTQTESGVTTEKSVAKRREVPQPSSSLQS